MYISKWLSYFSHTISIFVIITFLLKNSLTFMTLLLALGILGFNIYSLLHRLINPDPREFNKKASVPPTKRIDENGKTIFNAKQFEEKVKLAYQKNLSKKGGYFQEENKYWNNKYFYKDEKIEELKHIKLSDLAKERTYKGDHQTSFEISNVKKIRNFFEMGDQRQDSLTISDLEAEIKNVLKKSVSKEKIKQCLKAIELEINSKISNQYDNFVSDFNIVDKVIHRCFSVSLQLTPGSGQQSITYYELMQAIRLIDTKDLLPNWLTPNFSYVQVKKQIARIRANFYRLPDFTIPANLLRFSIFLKFLRSQFPDESIILSEIGKEESPKKHKKQHIFRYTEGNKIYYNACPSIKSSCLSTPTFLLLLHLWENHKRTDRGLLRQFGEILEL